jgi:integrase
MKYQTSDYLEWDKMLSLVNRLYRDKEYRMSLLIGCGSFFGLRISDLRRLTWSMLLDDTKFTIIEKKTQKHREVKINSDFQEHIRKCYHALNIKDKQQYCFLSRKGTIYSTQRINILFKIINKKYNLKNEHFSTHSLRKTFGRKVVEASGDNAEMAIIKLSELFNHSSPKITRTYLGLRREELMGTYDLLNF